MRTSCGLTSTGPGRIAICRMARGFPAGFKMRRPLTARQWFHRVEYPESYELYWTQPGKRHPQRVIEELEARAALHQLALACWERLPLHADNRGLRSIVAGWFFETLGPVVKERSDGSHQSWNWKKLPPFMIGRTPRETKLSLRPASGPPQNLETSA